MFTKATDDLRTTELATINTYIKDWKELYYSNMHGLIGKVYANSEFY